MNKNKVEYWINFWRYWFDLLEWNILTQPILKEQVCYDESIPDSDRYFIGVEIKKKYKLGIIYHDRELDVYPFFMNYYILNFLILVKTKLIKGVMK